MYNKDSPGKTNNNLFSKHLNKNVSSSPKSNYQHIKTSSYFVKRRKRFDKSKYISTNSELNYSNSLFNESNASFHLKAFTTMKPEKVFSFSSASSSSSSTQHNITQLDNEVTFNDQTSPTNGYNAISTGNELPFIKNIIQNEQEKCDNDYETEEYFLKLKLEEFNTAFYTLISITCGMLYHTSTTNDNNNNKPFTHLTQTITLMLITISVVLFNLSSLNRYFIILHIDKYTLQVLKTKTFCSVEYCGYFILELCISLMHPNICCRNVKVTFSKRYYRYTVTYEVNEMLLIITLLRVYVIFRFLIAISTFYSSRADRIAHLVGSHLNRLFVVRCIVLTYPFTFLVVTAIIFVVITGYMLRIAESPVYNDKMGDNDYRKYVNCLWNVLVTMTTVGYGDYYPVTTLGRLINIFVSLWGNCLTSFMVVALHNGLVFDENQEKAFKLRERQLLVETLRKKVAMFFKAGYKYVCDKKKYMECLKWFDDDECGCEEVEKLRMEMEEALYKKLNAKRQYKSTFQYYRNSYEVLTEKDIINERMDRFQELIGKMYEQTEIMEGYVERMNKVLDEIEDAGSNRNGKVGDELTKEIE